MKAEAYVCDYCNELKFSAEVVGVKPIEDLFNKLDGYPIDPHPDRQSIHLCTSCYNKHAVGIAERETNRKKDEKAYEIKLKEMSYLIKSQCVTNYNKKVKAGGDKKVAQMRKKHSL